MLFCSKLNTLKTFLTLPQTSYMTIFKPLSLFFCVPIDSKRYFYTCQLQCFVHVVSYHLTVLPKSMKTWDDSEYKNVNYPFPFAFIFKMVTIHVQKNFSFEIGDAQDTSFRGTCKWTINLMVYNKQKPGYTCAYSV